MSKSIGDKKGKNVQNKSAVEYNNFLTKHIVVGKDVEYSHTSFGPPWKKYNITDNELDTFYKLHSELIGVKDLYITERPKYVSQLLIDIDWHFRSDDKNRKYTLDDIKYVISKTNNILKNYYKLTRKMIKAFVFEKDKPSKIDDKEEYKDGFHIIYPYLPLTKEMRYVILNELRDIIEQEDGFSHINYTNSLDSVVDISIVHRNGWMLFGAKKYNGNLYKLTHIYKYNFEEDDKDQFNNYDLTSLLSNRKFKDTDGMEFKDDINKIEVNKKTEDMLIKYEDKRNNNKTKKKQTKQHKVIEENDEINEISDDENLDTGKNKNNYHNKEINKDKKKKQRSNINMAKKLSSILSSKRATEYHTWIRVGWALHNVSNKLLDTFKEFSQKTESGNYDESSCEKIWDKADDVGLTISSLHLWARQDNPEEYAKILRESINELFEEAETGTEYDIAKIVYELYKHSYRCVSIKHGVWYEFQGHRWVEIESGYTLHTKISEELTKEFAYLNSSLYAESATKEGPERENLLKRANNITKIILNLKKSGFKGRVLEECARIFYDVNFEEKLDSNKSLIGFNNGVYDLQQGCFREGTPDDYVTFTVGYDYVHYTMDHPFVKGIEDFFKKTQQEVDMREYILILLSSYLDGFTKQQKFIIWTGSGCHIKGTKIMMSDGSIKNVEDIKIGETLMGDDSTPRLVKQLFRGTGKMYKIIPIRGKPFIVNDEHVLCLKASTIGDITWSEMKKRYKLTWQEITENRLPKKCVKYFPIKYDEQQLCNENTIYYDNKEIAYNEAVKYREKIMRKQTYIKKGDIIDIKVKDWIKLRNTLGPRNYFLYKTGIEYEEKIIDKDPYDLGFELSRQIKEDIHIPENYLKNSRQNRLKLLAGFLDYNSQFYKTKNQVCLKSEKLTDDIVNLIRSLGFACNKYNRNNKKNTDYRIQIYGKGLEEIPILLTNKVDNIKKKDALLNTFTTEYVGINKYYGFELDKNHRYLMDDYTVTHNSNGKSTVLDFFQLAFGDYCGVLPTTVLTRRRGSSSAATPEMAEMKGKRFVVFQEPEGDDKIHVGFMKELTGSDYIYARPLFRDPIRFKPQFKLLLTCNKLPFIPSTDGGTWRRLRVAPWESEFVDIDDDGKCNGEPLKDNQFPKDYSLGEKLEQWKGAFLWYLINKYYKIYKKNDQKIKEPEKVLLFTKKYKKASDIYLEFIEDNLVLTEKKKDYETIDMLYSTFKYWHRESYSHNVCPSKKELVEYLTSHEYDIDNRYIYGAKFHQDEDPNHSLDE